jgi:hypothetical protein
LFQLQQVEIVLQNALHSQKGEITIRLREHMCMLISYFSVFLHLKKQLEITYSLWERAHQKTLDQHSNELTQQLIDAQLVLINSLEHGPFRQDFTVPLRKYWVNLTVADSLSQSMS